MDTVTTGTDGRVYVPLASDSYYAVETEAGKGYQIDSTPIYFTVEDGKTTTKTVTNKAISGILIHKVNAITGEGIPGVSFILYDSGNNPIAQETSDDRGYVRFENLTAGRYYLRELENEGYIPDTQKKTVYVKSGETTEIEWQNTPVTGQIQITKRSADYNPTNGLPAGTLLEGAVFEIYRQGRQCGGYHSSPTSNRGLRRLQDAAACPAIPSARSKRLRITPSIPR
ncbi:MAG: collagen binding domain-containing protein [Dysosmobacter sp.]